MTDTRHSDIILVRHIYFLVIYANRSFLQFDLCIGAEVDFHKPLTTFSVFIGDGASGVDEYVHSEGMVLTIGYKFVSAFARKVKESVVECFEEGSSRNRAGRV